MTDPGPGISGDCPETKNPVRISDSDSDNENQTPKVQIPVEIVERIPKRAVPNVNVPEKIILCVDVCQNENCKPFQIDLDTISSLGMLKRVIEFFLYSKQAINNDTEFALIVLKENEPIWVCQFTKNIIEIINNLHSFDSEICSSEEFDLSLLFNLIHNKINLPELNEDYKLVAPNNVARVIIFYNRQTIPKFISGKEVFDTYIQHPYFTVDILYTHEDNCNEHNCEKVYDALQSLDNGYSYIFEVVKSTPKIHECGAKLLAHPLQRPLQKNSSYVL